MVTVEFLVAVDKLKVRIRLREPQLNDLFVLEELKLFKCFFEVLDFAEHLG